ncbi:hypothetical protein BLA29_013444, partial [Euroglyphus maynei]
MATNREEYIAVQGSSKDVDEYQRRTKTLIKKINLAEFNLFRRQLPTKFEEIEDLYVEYSDTVAESINEDKNDEEIEKLMEHKEKVDRMFSYIKALQSIKHHIAEFDADQLTSAGFEDLRDAIKQVKSIQQQFPHAETHQRDLIRKW